MKAVIVILLIIGIASAIPLKVPRKNLQDLLTQQNFNALLQQIQQNQDLYQPLIATFPAQYQLVAEWLASQGFVLPRFGSIQSHLRNIDFESMAEQFYVDVNEILQQYIQQSASGFFTFIFTQEAQVTVISNVLKLLEQALEAGALSDDALIQQNFIQNIFLTFGYMFEHQNELQQTADYFNDYFSVDEFIISFMNALNSNFAPLFTGSLNLNIQSMIQELLESFDFQEFFAPDFVSEFLMYCITNLDNAAVPISFLTSLGINYFNVAGQLFAGTFDPEQFMTPEVAYAALQWIVEHPNEFKVLAIFFISFMTNEPIKPIMITVINSVSSIIPNVFASALLELLGQIDYFII